MIGASCRGEEGLMAIDVHFPPHVGKGGPTFTVGEEGKGRGELPQEGEGEGGPALTVAPPTWMAGAAAQSTLSQSTPGLKLL